MTPYDRARNDRAFLDRFIRAYLGTNDPLDALWWQEHPDEAAPSGAPAPALALADLRRAMYAPGADQAAAERYRVLESELAHEREAVLAALVAADARAAPRFAPAGAVPSGGLDAAASAPVSPSEPAAPGRSRRPLLLALVAAVAAFAVGLLIAPALGRGPAPQPAPAPTNTAPFISGASGSGSSLGIFDQPQRDVDRPAIHSGARLLPQSFRRLRSAPTSGVEIYAAQDSEGDVCLVALSVEARLAATCTPVSAFQSAPLRLAFRAEQYRDEWTKTGTQVEVVATWGFLGRFTLEEKAVVGE